MALALGRFVTAVAAEITGRWRRREDKATVKAGFDVVGRDVEGASTAVAAVSVSSLLVGRREGLSACLSALTLSLAFPSLAAIMEADDDEELLERVKKDRRKRLQRQGVVSSSSAETGYLQELIYKLSRVGKAIDSNDFSEATSVLGSTTQADWVRNANVAFEKLTLSPEEKSVVEAFNSSLATLISSVDKHDLELSKSAFVSSASALEKWVELTGLVGLLKGL